MGLVGALLLMGLIVVLLSYFLGCLNGSVLISHFIIRDDVRSHGSGNAGLTNFYRTYGARYALGVIALDMGKTALACLLGGFLFSYFTGDRTLGVLLAGIGCSLGHVFPVFFGFRGGKGILSGGTLLWFIDWRVALVAWSLFALMWALSRYVSLGSVTSAVSAPISTFIFFDGNLLYTALCLIISALTLWCHRGNIVRLIKGTESKFRWHIDAPKEKGNDK